MNNRTLEEIRNNLAGKIYVYLKDENVARRFLKDAEAEGFLFGKKKPTESQPENIIALNRNKQLSYVGTMGRMAFQCNGGDDAKGKFHRIDYYRYVNGYEDFYYEPEGNRTKQVDSFYHGVVDITGDKCEEAAKFFSIEVDSVSNYEEEDNLLNKLSEKYDVVIGCED